MSTPNATSSDQTTSFLGDLLSGKTQGVKNIEAAYTRAGASKDHTPGHASKLGSQEQQQQPRGPDREQGLGSKSFREGFQDQRPEPSVIGKVFNNIINGTDKPK